MPAYLRLVLYIVPSAVYPVAKKASEAEASKEAKVGVAVRYLEYRKVSGADPFIESMAFLVIVRIRSPYWDPEVGEAEPVIYNTDII